MMPRGGLLILEAESYRDLLEPSRDYLMDLIDAGPGKPVAKKWRTDPGIYGKNFVAAVLSHPADAWDSRFRERGGLPSASDFTVSFKDVALTRTNPDAPPNQPPQWKSGTETAEERCELAFTAFLARLEEDRTMNGRVQEVRLVSVESGDRDRLGNAFIDLNNPNNQLLWTLAARVRIVYAA